MTPSIQFHPYTKASETPAPKRQKNGAAAPAPEMRLHSISHTGIDYTARETDAGGADPYVKHYIGVFDPSDGTLQVVEARKMEVRGKVRTQAAADAERAQRVSLACFAVLLGPVRIMLTTLSCRP